MSTREGLKKYLNCVESVFYIICFSCFTFTSCSSPVNTKEFDFFLNEPCMIINYEQNNTIEGTYIKVKTINRSDSVLVIQIPDLFFLTNDNCINWNIGWGNNQRLFDAGLENLRSIRKIDREKGIIYLGGIVRGDGFPKENQRIVFWNKAPSGFINLYEKPIIDTKLWPQFSGKSVHFSSVEYDSLLNKWVMFFNECDTSRVQIYAALSDDLINWKPANKGLPILGVRDFDRCAWAGFDKKSKHLQIPFVTDIIRHENKWYLFLDGSSNDGKRHIGIAFSKTNILGPYEVMKTPVLSPGKKGSWNDESVFYAKVKKLNDSFIMFYDGRNKKGYERIGMATSEDLIQWVNNDNNPVVDEHTGWRSSIGCTEPNYIEVRGDSILLMVAGVKKSRMYLNLSGNVDDAQLGVFMSTDGGNSFTPHKNNPIFVNDYSSNYENEHMGGNFKLIQTDTADFIIYQAKSSYEGSKYNILLRTRYKE